MTKRNHHPLPGNLTVETAEDNSSALPLIGGGSLSAPPVTNSSLQHKFHGFGCDRWPLHYACRTGQLHNVQYLVDVLHCSVNEADRHDATPLYLAALTGHTEICHFLLQRGARCDANDGDAARIFYVALTPQLRTLLREWSLTAAAEAKDPVLEHVKTLWNNPSHANLVYSQKRRQGTRRHQHFYLHCAVVHARCPFLSKRIVERTDYYEEDGENCDEDSSSSSIRYRLSLPEAACCSETCMNNLFQYLYTGSMELRFNHHPGRLEALDVRDMAAQWGWSHLAHQIEQALAKHDHELKAESLDEQISFNSLSGNAPSLQIDDWPNIQQSWGHFRHLAAWVSTPHGEIDSLESLSRLVAWSDATLQCDNATWSVHTAFLCPQAEYFTCAWMGHFREAAHNRRPSEEEEVKKDGKRVDREDAFFLDVSDLFPNPEAWKFAIQFLYAGCFVHEDGSDMANNIDQAVSLELAVQVLELGYAILCPRLGQYVSHNVLLPAVDHDTAIALLDVARRHHGLERLEDKCVDVIGAHFASLKDDPDLKEILTNEAAAIVQAGDVQVADVPLGAEIGRAIAKAHNQQNRKQQRQEEGQQHDKSAPHSEDPLLDYRAEMESLQKLVREAVSRVGEQ